jgi:hypothetical protein
MKQLKTSKIVIFFLACLLSCQNQRSQYTKQLPVFYLENIEITTEIKLSELSFFEIKYIPLETKEESLLQGVSNLKFCEENILVHFFETILKFKPDGSFIAKIGNQGRGPDEFQTAQAVNLNPKTKSIYVLSRWENKFYVYSKNGEFIRSFSSPSNSSDFIFTEDGILCYSNNSFADVEYSYNLIDTTGSIIKRFQNKYVFQFEKPSEIYVIPDESIFYAHNNQTFKKEVHSDTIYKFENLDFIPHIVIDHRRRLFPVELRSKSGSEIVSLSGNYWIQNNLFEFGDFLYYQFSFVNRLITSKDNSIKPIIVKRIINDLDGGPDIDPITNKDDFTIVGWVDAFRLKAHVESESFRNSTPIYPEKKKQLEELAASLDENDNPVLMLVKLKE